LTKRGTLETNCWKGGHQKRQVQKPGWKVGLVNLEDSGGSKKKGTTFRKENQAPEEPKKMATPANQKR